MATTSLAAPCSSSTSRITSSLMAVAMTFTLLFAPVAQAQENAAPVAQPAPVVVQVQAPTVDNSSSSAYAQAMADSQADANKVLWAGAGCAFGLLGVLGAYLIIPSAPAARLIGKSPDYVVTYTTAYTEHVRTAQTKSAAIGCLISSCVSSLFAALSVQASAYQGASY